MGTVRVTIANGYRPQVDAYVEAHPGLTREDAIRGWVERRYGGWIGGNLGATAEYAIDAVDAQGFDISFTDATHSARFMAAVGGREVG